MSIILMVKWMDGRRWYTQVRIERDAFARQLQELRLLLQAVTEEKDQALDTIKVGLFASPCCSIIMGDSP